MDHGSHPASHPEIETAAEPTPAPAPKGVRFGRFRTDKEKETKGVWITVSPGFRLRIARLGNPDYQAAMMRAVKPYQSRIKMGIDAPADEISAQVIEAVSKTVLLDWEGLLEDDDRTPITYSQKKAAELLAESNDFAKLVLQLSQDVENFRTEAEAERAKN